MLKLKYLTCFTSYFSSVFSKPLLPIFSSLLTASSTVFSNSLFLVFTRPSLAFTRPSHLSSSLIFCFSIKFKLRFFLRPLSYLPVLFCVSHFPAWCIVFTSGHYRLALIGRQGHWILEECWCQGLYYSFTSKMWPQSAIHNEQSYHRGRQAPSFADSSGCTGSGFHLDQWSRFHPCQVLCQTF